jgi:hypothetical protein
MNGKEKDCAVGAQKDGGAGRLIIGGAENPAVFPGEIAIFYAAYRV